MVRKSEPAIGILIVFCLFISLGFVVADGFSLNGTVYDPNGVALNGTNVSVLIRDGNWASLGYNSTLTNESGYFIMNVTNGTNYKYQLTIQHTNSTYGFVEYVGQSLPAFPYSEFSLLNNVKFYLKPAGTINITAVNSSGDLTEFGAHVKDTKLGYPVEGCTASSSNLETICKVPRGRNYSLMVYPMMGGNVNFVPVSFNWDNFTSTSSYNVTDNLGYNASTYNATSKTLKKQFNITESYARITGYIQNSSGGDFADWRNFTIVPFVSEPGNMIFMGFGTLPWNASAFNSVPQTDEYNTTSGWYNITLPYAAAETVNYFLYAAAQNSTFMGSYLNITVSGDVAGLNFTMYELMGEEGMINMSVAGSANRQIVYTKRQNFKLVNSSTNASLSGVSAHVEAIVNYSDYGCKEFTFMESIAATAGSNFSLPLLNVTGFKEMNVYSMNFAPKRVSKRTAAQIIANPNISMSVFNPESIDGSIGKANIFVALMKSNATCDVPNPSFKCSVTDSSNMNSFNPLSAVVGGGALSFRMGMANSGIEIHYVNVDMLASGPPDGLFDGSLSENNGTSTGDSFSSALKFGSNGPTIYDYVLVSIPYTKGNATRSGLNDSQDVNVSIPLLYDENWNIIWNASVNGTNGTSLGNNYSHYVTYKSDWEILMGQVNCTRNVSEFNATTPCYIDTDKNKTWVRLPHFSGTGPTISGSSVVAGGSSSGDSPSGGGGSSGLIASFWKKTVTVSEEEFEEGYTKELGEKQRLKIKILSGEGSGSSSDNVHHVGVIKLTSTTVTINVSSTPQQATLSIGDMRKFDVTDDGYYDLYIKLNSISNNKADLTIKAISEKVTEESTAEEQEKESSAIEERDEESEREEVSQWWWVILIAVLIVVIVGTIIWKKKSSKGK